MNVTGGATDVTTYFVLRLSATGVEATGLTITNFDLQYVRTGAAPSTKADATALAAADSAHGDNQAFEVDATDQPGLYRVDWPDAAFAAGVKQVILSVKCATCFTEHMAVEIDAPVNTTKINGTAQTAGDVVADVAAVHVHAGTIETDVAAVHTHVGTIDGHITADYTATEKAAIDLLDDVDGGIADIHTVVNDLHTDVADIHTDVGTAITAIGDVHATDLPAVMTMLTDIHNTDLPAVKTVVDGIEVHVHTTIPALLPAALVGGRMDCSVGAMAAGVVTAAAIATDAIDADALAADALAEINVQCDLALTDIHLDHLLAVDYDPASKPGTATALLNELIESDAGVSRFTVNALENGPSGSGASAAAIADAVWDEVLHTDHEVAGSASVLLQSAGGAADPWATALPGGYGAGTAGKIIGDNINAPIGTVDTVVDAIKVVVDNIHDTDLPDVHTDIGTAITAIGDVHATDLPAVKTVLDDIHNTDLPAIKTVVDDIHATDLPAVKTVVDGIEVHVHTTIPGLLPAALVGGRMDASVGAMAAGVVTSVAIATDAIDADALAADAVDEIIDEVVEGTTTLRQALRIALSALAGKSTGGGTATLTFRDIADSKARITATVDANGNRTAITRDGT